MNAIERLLLPYNEYTVGVPGIQEARDEYEALLARIKELENELVESNERGATNALNEILISKLQKDNATMKRVVEAAQKWRKSDDVMGEENIGCSACNCVMCELVRALEEYELSQ